MLEEQVRVLGHDRASEGIALVLAQVMSLAPASADKLLEVSARVELLVVRRQVVQQLGRSMHTLWRQTDTALVLVFVTGHPVAESCGISVGRLQ